MEQRNKQKVIEDYVSRFSPQSADNGDHLRIYCPLCKDHARRFYVRVSNRGSRRRGYCCCFNCNFKSKSFVSFISLVEGCSEEEALALLGEDGIKIFKPNDLYAKLSEDPSLGLEEVKQDWKLPNSFESIAFPGSEAYKQSPYARKAYSYLIGRGISDEQIKKYDLRYCKSYGRYFGMLVIPVYEQSKPVYFCTRAFTDSYTRKTVNPTVDELGGVGKSDVVFGLDRAKDKRFCVVTEGPFDAMTLDDYGVALLGKKMSQKQQDKLLNSKVDRIYIMLDADAIESARVIHKALSRWVSTIIVPMLDEEKDVNNIGKKAAWVKIREAVPRSSIISSFYNLLGIAV